MRRVRTSELSGAALDWAVAQCEGQTHIHWSHFGDPGYSASTDCSQGHPIIEREGINLRAIRSPGHPMDGLWLAMPKNSDTGRTVQWIEFIFKDENRPGFFRGETALIAAMRCYVTSRLGNEVDIPEELLS